MKPMKIDEKDTYSRDDHDLDEKGAGAFLEASGSVPRSVLVQVDHLKSLILIARAQRDTNDSQRLANLISHLENALHDFDVASTPADAGIP